VGKKFNFEFKPLTLEELRKMDEDSLYTNINKFRRFIREAGKIGKTTLPFETEFCYLEHERQMRARSQRSFRERSRNTGRR
jgi:hypothetical protein